MLRSKNIIRISRHFKQLPLPFKRCVEIVLVCNYQLRAVSNEKFRYLNEQSNDKQNGSDNVKGTELFTKLCTLPSSSKKKLNVLLNLNYLTAMFSHWHKEEIILFVFFYTL